MLLRQAVRRIARAHCRPGRVTRVVSSRHDKNRVLMQRPRPGRRLRQGAKVNLWVGKGPRRR